jgi:hypothetical protein
MMQGRETWLWQLMTDILAIFGAIRKLGPVLFCACHYARPAAAAAAAAAAAEDREEKEEEAAAAAASKQQQR